MPKLGVLPKKQVSYKAGVADLTKIFLVAIIPRLEPGARGAEKSQYCK